MTVLSRDQIAALAAAVGCQGEALDVAVAIAMAESGGNPAAVGDTTLPHASYGLWQINAIHDSEPEIAALGGAEACVDAAKCAQAMWIVSSHGTNWEPWSTFKNGAYQKYLGAVSAPVAPPQRPAGPSQAVAEPAALRFARDAFNMIATSDAAEGPALAKMALAALAAMGA